MTWLAQKPFMGPEVVPSGQCGSGSRLSTSLRSPCSSPLSGLLGEGSSVCPIAHLSAFA